MTITTMTITTTTGMATMTKHAQDNPRPKSRSRQGASDKIWAVGLAGATCIGLVGTVGVRAAQDAAASTAVPDSGSVVEAVAGSAETGSATAVSSTGLTEAQLDQYARALQEERVRLEAYHAELLNAAARLQESVDAISQAQGVIPASTSTNATSKQANNKKSSNKKSNSDAPKASAAQPAPAAKPVPQPAAAPQVAKLQAQTRGS